MSVKQTYRHKGGLKPGSYFLRGKDNKVKDGNLSFEGIIGDFLVAKGLATTEDNCTYLLNCCEGTISNLVTTEEVTVCEVVYPAGTSLTDLLNAIVECLTEGGGSTTVDTENGISGNGSGANKVRWGGLLNQNTTIDGTSTYSITFTNPTSFFVQTDGASANGMLRVSGLISQPSTLRHIKNSDATVYSAVDLDVDSTFGLIYTDANGLIGFRIFPDETDVENELAIRTKGIRDGTKSVGMFLKLTDATDGWCEWDTVPSTPVYDDYEDDTAAGVGGVAVGEVYSVTSGNPYGLADGALKKRRS